MTISEAPMELPPDPAEIIRLRMALATWDEPPSSQYPAMLEVVDAARAVIRAHDAQRVAVEFALRQQISAANADMLFHDPHRSGRE